MGVFDSDGTDASGHEQVVFCSDRQTGLKAIIGIYSTALGPALGGTRFYPYENEEAALADDEQARAVADGARGRADALLVVRLAFAGG